ncbi:MAG TPA: AAA domain-containing protein, partial [Solirubrobacteraceae bacterium]
MAFRVGEVVRRSKPGHVAERERFFTADSDPSQETAVLEARSGRGLLVEGPPGTGKSQTIVNMVADAIGTGRSLLVVCQKQAALEVVRKRLEAAGLGERVVMVNDVHKDRERIIRAIREQLGELFQRPAGASGWRQQREQTAARIEALERDLDAHHRALHAVDEQTGLSYRLVLGDLIALSREGPTPTLPPLRRLLGGLDPGRLAMLQEICAPTARLWLPAHYEGSVLADTRHFGTDDGSIENFQSDLGEFDRLECERLGVIERTLDALPIQDPEPYWAWSMNHGAVFRSLDPIARERLARWLDRLAGALEREPGSTAVQQELADIECGMLALPADNAPGDTIEVARAMSDEDLVRWTQLSDRLLRRPTFIERFSPSRWLAVWRRRGFMRRENLGDPAGLGAALYRESALRPLRARLLKVTAEIGEAGTDLGPMRVPDLISAARDSTAQLATAEALVVRLETYPEPVIAYAVARASTRQAVDGLIERIDQAMMRHAARARCREALDRLRLWMTDKWIDICL